MTADTTTRPSPRWGRRLLLFLLGAAAWTLLSCYPNPTIFLRNLARYRRLPIDPALEARMQWELPPNPAAIELFVDSLLVPTPDWLLYRVPWYVPTAVEAARTLHGDCEAKAIIFASLLAGKHLPFQVRASFSHIWVDYPGRRPRPGESEDIAYLQGRQGRLRLQRPGRVPWRTVLTIQREQLWDVMPLARKTLWLTGLLWVGLAALFLPNPSPKGQIASRWRPRRLAYLKRALWFAAVCLALISLAPFLHRPLTPIRWGLVDLWEVLALSLGLGFFLAWLTLLRPGCAFAVSQEGALLLVSSSLGPWQRERRVDVAQLTHLELEASPGGLRPWRVSAALRTGERFLLVREQQELPARAALRHLGADLKLPVVVLSDGFQSRAMPDEVLLNLRQRAARRPEPEAVPRPAGSDLEIDQAQGRWVLRYPTVPRQARPVLLGCALVPLLLAAVATGLLLRYPWEFAAWLTWILSACLLSLTLYLALLLRGEIVARLAAARVEIGEGVLTFYTREKTVESLPLDEIESVEIARRGEDPTIAVVAPSRVLHLRGLAPADHRPWLRYTIEQAIVASPDHSPEAPPSAQPPGPSPSG